MEDNIKKEDIMSYSFYNENHEYVVCLNVPKLEEIFQADSIILHESEHK